MFEVPMFPLSTVLLPHQALPLHIFEPRYRAMMTAIHPGTEEFGIVLIERGTEIGGRDRRSDVGTIGRIVSAEQLDDGRWLLVAVGTRRIQVRSWLPDAPFPRANVTVLAEPAPTADDRARRQALTPQLERILTMHARITGAEPIDIEPVDDVNMWMWQPAVVAPLGPFDAQRILTAERWHDRLDALTSALDDLEEVLRFRLST